MNYEQFLREIRIVAGIILIGVIAVKIGSTPDLNLTISKLNTTVDSVNTTVGKANVLLEGAHKFGAELSKDYYDPEHPNDGLYYNIQDDLYNSSRSSQLLSSSILDTAANINGGKNSSGQVVVGILPETETLVSSINGTVFSLSNDLTKLTDSASNSLVPLKSTLTNIDILSSELAGEMAKGGNVDITLGALSKAVLDVDTLMSDPNVKLTIANGQDITKHLASSAETLDDVMLPWRKRVGQLKLILGKLFDMLKITVPLPW